MNANGIMGCIMSSDYSLSIVGRNDLLTTLIQARLQITIAES